MHLTPNTRLKISGLRKIIAGIAGPKLFSPVVGDTALSLQIEKRQSEDLDFMKWLTKRNEKPEEA